MTSSGGTPPPPVNSSGSALLPPRGALLPPGGAALPPPEPRAAALTAAAAVVSIAALPSGGPSLDGPPRASQAGAAGPAECPRRVAAGVAATDPPLQPLLLHTSLEDDTSLLSAPSPLPASPLASSPLAGGASLRDDSEMLEADLLSSLSMGATCAPGWAGAGPAVAECAVVACRGAAPEVAGAPSLSPPVAPGAFPGGDVLLATGVVLDSAIPEAGRPDHIRQACPPPAPGLGARSAAARAGVPSVGDEVDPSPRCAMPPASWGSGPGVLPACGPRLVGRVPKLVLPPGAGCPGLGGPLTAGLTAPRPFESVREGGATGRPPVSAEVADVGRTGCVEDGAVPPGESNRDV